MENKPKAIEKKCPKCGSHNVQPTGTGHVVGSGQPIREANRFQYSCAECDASFFLSRDSK